MKSNLFQKILLVFLIFNIALIVNCLFYYPLNISKESEPFRTTLKISQTNPQTRWGNNGTAVCTAVDWQNFPQLCSDGEGGAVIAWYDLRTGPNKDIYAQRIDIDGNLLWDANGTVICNETHDQGEVQICSDGFGGAIVAWMDERDPASDIYAQRIDANGNVMWDANGTAICTENNFQSVIRISNDGEGGAIITWRDERSGNADVYAQRIDANGNTLWTDNGTAICNLDGYQGGSVICTDGFGGAILTWVDWRNSGFGPDIYAQRIAPNGTHLWGANGTGVCTFITNDQGGLEICSDGLGGAIIAWVDFRNIVTTGTNIYAERIDSNGNSKWNVNGKAICTLSPDQYSPVVCSNNKGGAIISWSDGRGGMSTGYDLYAQKLNSTGDILWAPNGLDVCRAVDNQWVSGIIDDGEEGAVILWGDEREGAMNRHIYAQRLTSEGNSLWQANGSVICNADGGQDSASLINDGKGGCIIAWNDGRSDSGDIYAQRIIISSTSQNPVPTIPFGNWHLLFIGISLFAIIFVINKRKNSKNTLSSKF